MALKDLTPQERAAARAKALEARGARAELKERFRRQEIGLADVFSAADDDPAIARLRTLDLLQTLHGVGEVRATAILDATGISRARRLGGLGRRQREALIAYIGR